VQATAIAPEPLAGTTTGTLRAALERALALGGRPVHRLGSAGTSVTFTIAGSDAATLLLDRHPPMICGGDEPAEIAIDLAEEQGERFLCGELTLPTDVLMGAVATRGPVRRYLALDPVLRALLARVAAED